ncbi:MAG: 2OG-Fe(II) oxygenase, partial [Gammaproteobacteria bacterium]|nr:2OG-Fe(II) oxygenase [Gammaproteobacteria bacterium]
MSSAFESPSACDANAGPYPDDALVEQVADALARDGYGVFASALPGSLLDALLCNFHSLDSSEFHRAGVGRDHAFRIDRSVRSDRICWLTGVQSAPAAYLAWAERLRAGLNRALFLGLFHYEAHYACYAPGDFYRRHLDAFSGGPSRILSTVVYLNRHWREADGGELLLYRTADDLAPVRVCPRFGTLVVFLSERFEHEVTMAHSLRYSIAGWF